MISNSCYTQNEVKNEKYVERDIYLKSFDSTLHHAKYYLPADHRDKRLPAVVIGHGSAPSTIDDVGFYTYLAKKLGMAILAYDKRGAGESEGTYESFCVERSEEWFDILAKDMSEFILWMSKQPEIDPGRIGLLGGSQAGWIMPYAAHKNSKVRFIIIGEGIPLSAGEEAYFSNLTGDGFEGSYTISEADDRMKDFDGQKGFDPNTILMEIDAEILWIFGTQDPVIPVDASIRKLRRWKNPKHEIVILENGDHNFMNTQTQVRYDLNEHIRPWLEKIGILD